MLHDQFVDPAQELLVGAVQSELFGIERLLRVLVAFFQPGAFVQNGPDAGFEIVESERFFNIGAGSGFHAGDLRRRVRDGRCYDDGDVREVEIRADRAAEFDAVRTGQGDVRDDDVHLLFLQYADGLFGRVYGDDPIVGVELVFEIGREFPVVLHEQQQRQRPVLLRRRLLSGSRFGKGRRGRKRQYERGAEGVVGEFERPGVHFGERTGEGESDAEAPGPGGLVVLHERFEYFGTLFGRDRLPVVGDGDRRRPVVRPDVYFDVGFRVFQGVVQQVVENLVHGRFVRVDADVVPLRREREPQVACFGGLLER